MGKIHAEPNYPLSGTDHEYYFGLHVLHPGYQPNGEGDSMTV